MLISSLLVPEEAVSHEPTYYESDALLVAVPNLGWEEPEEVTNNTATIDDSYTCGCVNFVRELSGNIQPPIVKQAIDIPVRYKVPVVGAWVLFKANREYSEWGHVGFVQSIGTSTITILERNYKKCAVTKREISLWDKNIRGYYY